MNLRGYVRERSKYFKSKRFLDKLLMLLRLEIKRAQW